MIAAVTKLLHLPLPSVDDPLVDLLFLKAEQGGCGFMKLIPTKFAAYIGSVSQICGTMAGLLGQEAPSASQAALISGLQDATEATHLRPTPATGRRTRSARSCS